MSIIHTYAHCRWGGSGLQIEWHHVPRGPVFSAHLRQPLSVSRWRDQLCASLPSGSPSSHSGLPPPAAHPPTREMLQGVGVWEPGEHSHSGRHHRWGARIEADWRSLLNCWDLHCEIFASSMLPGSCGKHSQKVLGFYNQIISVVIQTGRKRAGSGAGSDCKSW